MIYLHPRIFSSQGVKHDSHYLHMTKLPLHWNTIGIQTVLTSVASSLDTQTTLTSLPSSLYVKPPSAHEEFSLRWKLSFAWTMHTSRSACFLDMKPKPDYVHIYNPALRLASSSTQTVHTPKNFRFCWNHAKNFTPEMRAATLDVSMPMPLIASTSVEMHPSSKDMHRTLEVV